MSQDDSTALEGDVKVVVPPGYCRPEPPALPAEGDPAQARSSRQVRDILLQVPEAVGRGQADGTGGHKGLQVPKWVKHNDSPSP